MKKIKKTHFVIGFILSVGMVLNIGISSKKDKLMSDLSLANMEALALPSLTAELYKALFNAAYDASYALVKDRCPRGTVDCCSVSAELSAAGFATANVTFYYQKR